MGIFIFKIETIIPTNSSISYDLILMPVSRGKLFKQIRFGNIPEIVARFSKKPVILAKSHAGIVPPLWTYLKRKILLKKAENYVKIDLYGVR